MSLHLYKIRCKMQSNQCPYNHPTNGQWNSKPDSYHFHSMIEFTLPVHLQHFLSFLPNFCVWKELERAAKSSYRLGSDIIIAHTKWCQLFMANNRSKTQTVINSHELCVSYVKQIAKTANIHKHFCSFMIHIIIKQKCWHNMFNVILYVKQCDDAYVWYFL